MKLVNIILLSAFFIALFFGPIAATTPCIKTVFVSKTTTIPTTTTVTTTCATKGTTTTVTVTSPKISGKCTPSVLPCETGICSGPKCPPSCTITKCVKTTTIVKPGPCIKKY
ncbi:hypothetical protein C1645_833132 [Glomus cerebriforme]|uniref:Uncharacterized protein n=1 Tax=Glomus cerebriforme TaxID=658196 RepID=A0A397SI76_9GLOM|nr:hypothetical protein C1645_833132 [Glomus cerebriforme]